MPSGFDTDFARVKELVADFLANEKFYLSSSCRHDFQNGNGSGKMLLRINGRRIFKTETLASHGCHPVEGQQRHRIKIGRNPSRTRNQRLAQTLAFAGKAGFYFPRASPRCVRGRLFLARMSQAWPQTKHQSELLAGKIAAQQNQG
jgi:hypothetical protein